MRVVGRASTMWGMLAGSAAAHACAPHRLACPPSKYEVLERSMLPKLEALKQKLPELRKTIQMIEFLRKKQVRRSAGRHARLPPLAATLTWVSRSRRCGPQELGEEFHTHFNLSDGVHAKAAVKPKNVVYLWLGVRAGLLTRRRVAARALCSSHDPMCDAHRPRPCWSTRTTKRLSC